MFAFVRRRQRRQFNTAMESISDIGLPRRYAAIYSRLRRKTSFLRNQTNLP